MSQDQEIQQLELLCTQLYQSQDATVRTEAEKAMVIFQNSPEALSKCFTLLERSESPFAQVFACSILTKLVSKNAQPLPLQQRIDIRNYTLNYLAKRPKLPGFVNQALVGLFARITKLGWFDGEKDDYVFRGVILDVTQFLQSTVAHAVVGVQLLSQLTFEMNQVSDMEGTRSLTKHRKIASSFRDTQLYEIFRLSCTLLTTAKENSKNLNFEDETQLCFISQCLKLAQNCLLFDFIGTSTDEASDDLSTVQIPTSWRPIFLEYSTLPLFYDLYHALPVSVSHLALACLVQLASVRRSLFNNVERSKFLAGLVSGVKQILLNPQGLRDASNYHEFCRLLARLKSNYQLGELIMVPDYADTIRLITNFTVESLKAWQFAPNSVHYLLSLWQRMVASVPYVKSTEPHLLDRFTPEITNAYITARLEAVPVIIREGRDEPLEDMGMIFQQLEQISVIARCDYQKTCAMLVQVFDCTAAIYQQLITAHPNTSTLEIKIEELRLTWLVYVIGAAIGGRVSFSSNEENDIMDGEMVVRVMQLMRLTDSRLPQGGCEKLELAFINFFEQFRKIHIGEQIPKNCKVYKRLQDVLCMGDEVTVLSVVMRKIITNLKYWGGSEQTISRTLNLLSDLSVGYTCVRKLVKLEETIFLLNNHSSEHFPFLGNNVSFSEMRLRTMFYTSLGRLLLVDLGEEEDKFETFMASLTTSLDHIGNVLCPAESLTYTMEEVKKPLVGLARDLRGIAYAFNSKQYFMLLFDWIYPKLPIFVKAIDLWPGDPDVTTPILKLFTELVQNRSQRLQFDVTSPHGILLFREASKIICTYAKYNISREHPKDVLYNMKLKGISVCFSMLKNALCGNYVNFGVFRLYGDDTLDNVLKTFVELLLVIPRNGLLDYPKLSSTYYILLECLAQDHMNFLSTLESNVFVYILSTISSGLNALDTMISTGSCTTLDHIITYLFKQLQLKEKRQQQGLPVTNEAFLQVLELHSGVWQEILSNVLNTIMYDECRNQWSISRPLLGLILLNEQYFNQLTENIIRCQPSDKQPSMTRLFQSLMEGVERNLLSRNRDRFTQNLSSFKKDLTETLTPLNSPHSSNGDNMVI